MKNIQYQQEAVTDLTDKVIKLLGYEGERQTLVFKAPTGSGKTVMAAEMLRRLNDELDNNPRRTLHRSSLYLDSPQQAPPAKLLQDEERLH